MMSWLFKAAGREILPFKDDPADGILDKQLLFGPFKLWCCVVEVYGYCQVLFWLLATAALVFVIWEIARKGSDFWRIAAVAGFFLTSGLLVWFAKGIYVLRLMRKETGRYRKLNDEMKTKLEDLTGNNEGYKKENANQEHLNKELKDQVENCNGQITNMKTQNEEHHRQNKIQEKLNTELAKKIKDLQHVEKQLGLLSQECQGSVTQARTVLERLEKNIRLDTINSVFLFFDRCDSNKDGTVEVSEIEKFVDSLSFLFKKLPTFNQEKMKKELKAQGGITLDQVHNLVEAILKEEDEKDPKALDQKLGRSFTRSPGGTMRLNPAVSGDTNDDRASHTTVD